MYNYSVQTHLVGRLGWLKWNNYVAFPTREVYKPCTKFSNQKKDYPKLGARNAGLIMTHLDSSLASWHIPELSAELRGPATQELNIDAIRLLISHRLAEDRSTENRNRIRINDWFLFFSYVHISMNWIFDLTPVAARQRPPSPRLRQSSWDPILLP
jgi:hypothetical protein